MQARLLPRRGPVHEPAREGEAQAQVAEGPILAVRLDAREPAFNPVSRSLWAEVQVVKAHLFDSDGHLLLFATPRQGEKMFGMNRSLLKSPSVRVP